MPLSLSCPSCLHKIRQMPELKGMEPLKTNLATKRPVKRDGQLMLGFGGPHQLLRLPEENRSQCVSLLGRMLSVVIKDKQPKGTK